MKPSILVASLALAFSVSAQNRNQGAPAASHELAFGNGAAITVRYNAFTIAEGQTLRALNAGNAQQASFYNDQYVPAMLDGRLSVNAPATLGEEALEAGKYRFSFRLDEDGIWNLDVYTDTGEKTEGEPFRTQPGKGWWHKETKLVSIALDTSDTGKDVATRLAIRPEADPESNASAGSLSIRFGPLTASVGMTLDAPKKTKKAAGSKRPAEADTPR